MRKNFKSVSDVFDTYFPQFQLCQDAGYEDFVDDLDTKHILKEFEKELTKRRPAKSTAQEE